MESPVIKFDQMGKINMLLVKVASNLQYREEVQELLLHFTAIEKARKEFLWMPGVCLILLFYIQGEFDEVNKRKTNYKFENICSNNEEYSHLFSIGKKFNKDPYCDVYNHIQHFLTSKSAEVHTLAQVLLLTYERAQAKFISQIYSRIKIQSLKRYINNLIKEDRLNEYLSKYNWMLQDDYVITTLLKEEYDVASLKNDLGFINLMNVTLENIIKTNILIKPIEI